MEDDYNNLDFYGQFVERVAKLDNRNPLTFIRNVTTICFSVFEQMGVFDPDSNEASTLRLCLDYEFRKCQIATYGFVGQARDGGFNARQEWAQIQPTWVEHLFDVDYAEEIINDIVEKVRQDMDNLINKQGDK